MDNDFLYREAVILGTGSLALQCARELKGYKIPCQIYDTGEKPSKTLERQAVQKGVEYRYMPREELEERLIKINTPTLVVSAINPWILSKRVLDNPYLQSINCHQALLPAYPGRNAEMWAIYQEEEKTGITWHIIRPQVDCGEILIQKEIEIADTDTSIKIFRKQSQLAFQAFRQISYELLMGTAQGKEQTGERQKLRHSREVPEQGILDISWPFHKISAFLRALDYGSVSVVQRPFLWIKGERIYWKRYCIEKFPQSEEKICFEDDSIVIIRKEGKIILKGTTKE